MGGGGGAQAPNHFSRATYLLFLFGGGGFGAGGVTGDDSYVMNQVERELTTVNQEIFIAMLFFIET